MGQEKVCEIQEFHLEKETSALLKAQYYHLQYLHLNGLHILYMKITSHSSIQPKPEGSEVCLNV